MTSAVVFAYHSVGVHCLDVLERGGVEVTLLMTHLDDPADAPWFKSVSAWGEARRIPVLTPPDPNRPSLVELLGDYKPDLFFSFYYRYMLSPALLRIPPLGAYNLHGSLLPQYRGRAPVNWAVVRGEKQTGATLHAMTEKPDQGDIIGQEAFPIGPDETAYEVYQKLVDAGGRVLEAALPALCAGQPPRRVQDLAAGSYFGRRTPADGDIDWSQPAARIHDLVRGVAPPYPGAFLRIRGKPARILKTRLTPHPEAVASVKCADGKTLYVLELEWQDQRISARSLRRRFPEGVDAEPMSPAPPIRRRRKPV